MVMRPLAWIVVLAGGIAYADDAITVHARVRSEEQTEPLLHLDYSLPVVSEGLGGAKDGEQTVIDIGPRARIAMGSEWWKSSLAPIPLGAADLGADDMSRGWLAAYELSYNLGPFRLGANMGMGRVDSRYERGSYRVMGVSVSRQFRLSRWVLAWISLGIGQQTWQGQPPPGEANNTTAMLRFGFTFR
ncbi:MAG TPA: hypothetical protein VIV40_20515 [Kofleriaceae bacterium]